MCISASHKNFDSMIDDQMAMVMSAGMGNVLAEMDMMLTPEQYLTIYDRPPSQPVTRWALYP